MPISSGPAGWKIADTSTCEITESLHTRIWPGVSEAQLDGREGSPVATTLWLAEETLIAVIRLAGSRSATSSVVCVASSQLRKNGAVSPVTSPYRVPVLR